MSEGLPELRDLNVPEMGVIEITLEGKGYRALESEAAREIGEAVHALNAHVRALEKHANSPIGDYPCDHEYRHHMHYAKCVKCGYPRSFDYAKGLPPLDAEPRYTVAELWEKYHEWDGLGEKEKEPRAFGFLKWLEKQANEGKGK